MSSSRYAAGQAHQRERTQLFANASPYTPSQMMRPETPNAAGGAEPAGSYSDSFLDHLESQHDEQISGLTSKVRMLKDISLKIGEEARASSTVLSSLEDGFESARVTVRSTMTRMVRSVREGGVSCSNWIFLFALTWVCFFIVWML